MSLSSHLTASRRTTRDPVKVYLSRLSPGSRETMSGSLDTIANILFDMGVPLPAHGNKPGAADIPWHTVDLEVAEALRTELASRYKPSTANKMLSALRGVLKACADHGLMTMEDYHKARQIGPVKGTTLLKGRALETTELQRLMAVCDPGTNLGARDRALLAIAYGCGLRRSELINLNVADYATKTGRLVIHHGKGNKARDVYVGVGMRKHVEAWLALRGTTDGPLFLPIRRGDHIQERRMNMSAIRHIFDRLAELAGIDQVAPHDFRRTFISHMLDNGADISTVQQVAGHSSVVTTQRYDRRGDAAKVKIADLLALD